MKKKLLMVMTVATLILSSTMTAFAAGSPEASKVKIEGIVDEAGQDISASFELGELDKATQETGKNKVEAGYSPFWFELSEKEGSTVSGKFTASFGVEGVKAGDTVKVFYQDANGAWKEATGAVAANGKVTVTLENAGPVLISVKNATVSGGGATAVPDSPKTGESNVMLYVALLGMVALVGAVATKRRAN